MPIITCENCGAKYSYEEMKISMRDKDYQKCEICDNILKRWNGGVTYYNFKLIPSDNANSEQHETED